MSPMMLLISSVAMFLVVGLAFGCVEHFRPARRLQTDGRWLATSLLGVALLLLFANLSDRWVHAPVREWIIANVTGPVRIRLPHLATMMIALVLNDFIGYWIHRGLHAFGWPIHRWHHSAKSLNWLSGTFGSFPHFVLTLGPPIVPAVLFDFSGPEFLFGYVSFVFIQHWNHSNFAVARGSWFEWFFITPQAHRIHHAASRELHDANFGFVFTAWDRMFGTFVDPNAVMEDFEVGLGEREKPGLLRMIIGY